MKTRSLHGALCASVCAAATFAAANVGAQTAGAQASNSQDVVVTARRTSESIRTVPVTVQAFSNATLRQDSISQTSDLMFHVTGINMAGALNQDNSQYVLRGVSPSGQQGQQIPGVMSYFAEVPLPPNGQSQPAYDIANIQVLKGPQGTLFGKNTTGGAVLIYPETPNYRGYNGYLDVIGGSYNWREFQGAVNLPIIDDKLAIRIAAHDAQRDGYIQNLTPGAPAGSGINNWGARVQVRWDPTARISNNLMFDYYQSANGGPGVSLVECNAFAPASPFGPGCPSPVSGPNAIALPVSAGGYGSLFKTSTSPTFAPYSRLTEWGVTDRLEVQITPSLQFTNIAAYREAKFDTQAQEDGTPFGLFDTEQLTNEGDWSEEAQLKGNLFDNKVRFTTGAFYSKTDPLSGNAFKNVLFFSNAGDGYPFLSRQSEAIYGDLIINLDDLLKGLEADLGVRYTWDQFSLCTGVPLNLNIPPDANFTPSQCNPTNPALGPGTGLTSSGSSSAPTWSVGLNWKANQDLFFYVVSRRGYRSGGINGPTFTGALAAFQSYKPELVTDVEGGERSSFHLGGMSGTLDMSAFYASTANVQQTAVEVSVGGYNEAAAFGLLPGYVPCPPVYNPALGGGTGVPPGGTGTNYGGTCNPYSDPIQTEVEYNAGTLVSKGFEFQTTLSPIENLTLSAGGSIYSFQFSAAAGAIPSIFLPYYALFFGPACSANPAACLSGNYGIQHTYTAGLRYAIPLHADEGTVVFNANVYFSGQGAVISGYQQQPYNLINLRLDWNHVMGGPVDLSLFARNAGDTHYAISGAEGSLRGALPPFAPGAGIVLGEPRVIGGELRWEFGQ